MKAEKINTAPKETAQETADKLIDAALENARDLHEQIMAFQDSDIVGSVARDEVEDLARMLGESLSGIPPQKRMEEGLPYHPHEDMLRTA